MTTDELGEAVFNLYSGHKRLVRIVDIVDRSALVEYCLFPKVIKWGIFPTAIFVR